MFLSKTTKIGSFYLHAVQFMHKVLIGCHVLYCIVLYRPTKFGRLPLEEFVKVVVQL